MLSNSYSRDSYSYFKKFCAARRVEAAPPSFRRALKIMRRPTSMPSHSDLITEVNRRTGVPERALATEPLSTLLEHLESTKHERLVEADEAVALLEDDEMPRVFDFILNGISSRRSLLVGSVSTDEFIDSFLVLDNDSSRSLIVHGRSLRDVVETIRGMGGLERAAASVPWLEKCLPLARNLDWRRLATRLIFVRRASAEEAASSYCPGQGAYIEEGQHRAIAAAWILMGGSAGHAAGSSGERLMNNSHPASISYLRGVNRQGAERGHEFWDVGATSFVNSPLSAWLSRFSTLHCACALLACAALRWLLREPRRRRQSRTRHEHERRSRAQRNRETEVFLMGLHKRWL